MVSDTSRQVYSVGNKEEINTPKEAVHYQSNTILSVSCFLITVLCHVSVSLCA